ncbi:TetR family transcriptional regulator C-terminal domain-containing protein [Kordiimonas pumila]|uniref:TetR family transcriptional regulator C-terminal domain-containing protein n=1 Tax=Kordiimonas pumila TaxID=2161677 RepID=A0ABV7D5I1_9PROT|nr:TetR family transcriptional regulator C-terminal domain-containing protein [Kordiimonas pumila]
MTRSKNIFSVDHTTDDKKQLFIDATIASLSEHGYKGTTVRKIAEIAKVAPGLLTHYYSGKEVLIAESYRYMTKKFLGIFQERIAEKKNKPLEALQIFFFKTFEKDNLDPKVLRVWLAFWSLTLLHKELSHIHKETYQEYITSIEDMLTEAYSMEGRSVDPEVIKAQAIGINAILDGLWLEWCLNPETFSPAEGLQIVRGFVAKVTGLEVPEYEATP